jgi:glycosyltransferase involved in cell wall biosynthesis
VTETFVVSEMTALERHGAAVELYPLVRSRCRVLHSEAARFVERAHYQPLLSLPIFRANCYFARRQARTYFKALADIVRQNWDCPKLLFGAIGIFPKAVRFAYEMAAAGVDHIHAHFAHHPAAAALIIHRLTRIPFSFTGHGTDVFYKKQQMLSTKVEAAEFVVTISAYNRDFIASRCAGQARSRIHVIHCGVDLAKFSPPLAERPPGPLQIVSVGSLIEVKGHKYLIDACHLLEQRGIDFVCRIVGEGKLKHRLEEQISELGLRHRVQLAGGASQSQVAEMYKSADVAALTSAPNKNSREGIPVGLMEAMATGLPVVASAISGIPELVDAGQTGFLTAPKDVAAIADALEELARNRYLRRQMGIAGRAKVIRYFNLERNAGELLQRMMKIPEMESLNPERMAA